MSCPGGAADSVGSPPPTSTTVPGWLAGHHAGGDPRLAVQRQQRGGAVSVLLVDAGSNGTSSVGCQSSLPVMASVTRPPSLPRLGSATTAASAAASPDAVGIGAVAATGTMLDLAVTAGGGGGTCAWAAPWTLPVSNAAAATTAATNASTPTPTIKCVDGRQ